jgi:hypothetical protein
MRRGVTGMVLRPQPRKHALRRLPHSAPQRGGKTGRKESPSCNKGNVMPDKRVRKGEAQQEKNDA